MTEIDFQSFNLTHVLYDNTEEHDLQLEPTTWDDLRSFGFWDI